MAFLGEFRKSPVDWQVGFGGLRDCYTGNRLRTAGRKGALPYRFRVCI